MKHMAICFAGLSTFLEQLNEDINLGKQIYIKQNSQASQTIEIFIIHVKPLVLNMHS